MIDFFKSRAVELGLYREQKISFLDKIFSKGKERFIPVEVKKDNCEEYWSRIKKNLAKAEEVVI